MIGHVFFHKKFMKNFQCQGNILAESLIGISLSSFHPNTVIKNKFAPGAIEII